MKNQQFIAALIFLSLFELLSINIQPAHANPQQCYKEALPRYADSNTADLVAEMCQGSGSTVTAQCFTTALPRYYEPLAAKRAAMLCKGVTSIAPGECFRDSIGSYPDTQSLERAYKLCKVNSPPENNPSRERPSGDRVRGSWFVKMSNNWIGLLRMRGEEGYLVMVDRKGGNLVEQKIKVERDSANEYILTGTITQSSTSNYPSDKFYIQQFSTNSEIEMTVKNCDTKNGCYDVKFIYWGE